MTGFGSYITSGEFAEVIKSMIESHVSTERPKPRGAQVVSINRDERFCMVIFNGETTPVKIPYGGTAPAETGQYVRVDGLPGDRVITDVLGDTQAQAIAAAAAADVVEAQRIADLAVVAAADAQATADGKTSSYFQNEPPSGTGHDEGDMWFDTNDGFKMHRWVVTTKTWVAADDQRIAQAFANAQAAATAAGTAQQTADRKIVTYYQDDQPAVAGQIDGNLWVKKNNNNEMFRFTSGAWVSVRDTSIAAASASAAAAHSAATAAMEVATAAKAIADGTIRTFYQATAPTGLNDDTNLGDLWFNTTTNQASRWLGSSNGGWKLIIDNSIATALAAAQNAQTTADGKIDSFYQSTAPTIAQASVGDLWYNTADKNKVSYLSTKTPMTWVPIRDLTIADAQQGVNEIKSRGIDLVTNGTGMMGDNTNFKSFTFDPTDTPVGGGSFDITATNASPVANELIPVDLVKKYQFSWMSKQKVAGSKYRMYGMVVPYDIAEGQISPIMYMHQPGTTTTLAAELKTGDTTVTLTSAANWNNTAADNASHLRSLILWDYVDSKGKAWGVETYSRNYLSDAWAAGGITGNVITLRRPWNGPSHPAGTPISNGSSGGNYMYIGASNQIVPEEWTAYAGECGGAMTSEDTVGAAVTKFPPGTAFIRVGWLTNRPEATGTQSSRHSFAAVSFSDATAARSRADAAVTEAQTAKANAAAAQTRADKGVSDAKAASDAAVAAQQAAATADQKALAAAGVANGKGTVYYLTDAPPVDNNGLWIDIDDGNKAYTGVNYAPAAGKNLSINPRAGVGPGWSANNTYWTHTLGAAITDHPLGIKTAVKSVVATPASAQKNIGSMFNLDGLGNYATARFFGVWVLSPTHDVTAFMTAGATHSFPVKAGVWTFISSPAKFVGHVILYMEKSTASVAGDTVYATGSISSLTPFTTFYDGGMPGCTWDGTVNFSPSSYAGPRWLPVQDAGIKAAADAATAANTAAGTAKTAADAADQKAVTAQADAAKAKKAADDAQATANQAHTIASTAAADVVKAKGVADQALADAFTAKGIADGKADTFFADTAPTNMKLENDGDLWFKTPSLQMWRYIHPSGWVVAQDQSIAKAIADAKTADDKAVAADGKAVTATTLAGTKISTFYTNVAPTATGRTVGDLWIDTANGNMLKRWESAAVGWRSVQDTTIAALSTALAAAQKAASDAMTVATQAKAIADGTIRTWYQDEPPTLTLESDIGDLWLETDTNIARRWTGVSTGWAVIADTSIGKALQAAQNAQTTADGKIDAYYQGTTPTVGALGDLWYNTAQKNKPHYCSKAAPNPVYTEIRDLTIADAQAKADAAATTADTAVRNAKTAQDRADTAVVNAADARTQADKKTRSWFQADQPTGLTALDVGDLWFKTNLGFEMWRYVHPGWEKAADQQIAKAVKDAKDAADAAGLAQSTADKKIVTYYQDEPPAAAGQVEGNLWVDTNDNNKLYRWNTQTVSWIGILTQVTTPSNALALPDLHSTGWVEGGDVGWVIRKDGTAEFFNMKTRGSASGPSASYDVISTPSFKYQNEELSTLLGARGIVAKGARWGTDKNVPANQTIALYEIKAPDALGRAYKLTVDVRAYKNAGGFIDFGMFYKRGATATMANAQPLRFFGHNSNIAQDFSGSATVTWDGEGQQYISWMVSMGGNVSCQLAASAADRMCFSMVIEDIGLSVPDTLGDTRVKQTMSIGPTAAAQYKGDGVRYDDPGNWWAGTAVDLVGHRKSYFWYDKAQLDKIKNAGAAYVESIRLLVSCKWADGQVQPCKIGYTTHGHPGTNLPSPAPQAVAFDQMRVDVSTGSQAWITIPKGSSIWNAIIQGTLTGITYGDAVVTPWGNAQRYDPPLLEATYRA